MSNNLFKVWSPDGSEMVETSRANARDLTTHAGWLSSPPTVIEKIVVVEKETANEVVETETKAETPAATETPVTEEEAPAAETEEAGSDDDDAATGDDESADEDTKAETPAVRTTEEDFADLESREDVVAYLAAAFPDFKPHHLMKRDKLVLKAIELATA